MILCLKHYYFAIGCHRLSLHLQDSEDKDVSDDENNQSQISYDVSKLVDFPGFNVMASPNVRDVSVNAHVLVMKWGWGIAS